MLRNTFDKFQEDLYERSLKKYYFPLLSSHPRAVCVIWVIIFVISIVYGPQFLSLTKNSLDLPSQTPSVKALNAFEKYYPDNPTTPPAIFFQTSRTGTNIVNSYTKEFSDSLSTFISKYDSLSFASGYWENINVTDGRIIALGDVAPSNLSMITNVFFKNSANQDTITKVTGKLIDFAISQSNSNVYIACTGINALFYEMTQSTESSFLLIDATVIPVAVLILGANLRSYRHMLIAFCNLGCTLLLGFALLVPVANSFNINPFAPSIMLSLGVAICFDYSLFMLNRFREEIVVKKSNRKDAVLMCLYSAGHVVMLSGLILLFTFLLLVTFPQSFLQSVGIACSTVVFTALLANMTLTPALLLSFECFEFFEFFPSSQSFCCYISDAVRNNTKLRDESSGYEEQKNESDALSVSDLYDAERSMRTSTSNTDNPHHSGKQSPLKNTNAFENGYLTSSAILSQVKSFISVINVEEEKLSVERMQTYFFVVPYNITRYPWIALLLAAAFTAPLLYQTINLSPTSDNNLIYLPGSRSYNAYQELKQDFPIGSIDPYNIVVATNIQNSTFTSNYFTLEHSLIQNILLSNSKYLDTNSITSISYCQGKRINFTQAVAYKNVSSPLYDTQEASDYRGLTKGIMNVDQTATLIQIKTIVDPDSQAITNFIVEMRNLINSFTSTTTLNGNRIEGYLFGGYTTTYDLQVIVYNLVPTMIGVTISAVVILIAWNFGSLALTLRLMLSVGMSLCWTYGMLVSVYQPGQGQNAFAHLTPSINRSSGVYWLIPIMSFSILIGLALDYDIFLMSRMVEFRKLGWSDRAAICLSIQKTGFIITTAGLIMSVSFAGLLIPKTIVLNQYGFALFLGVLFDTFIIRTTVVPAVIAAFGTRSDVFWWPSVMPTNYLSPEEEEKALFQGLWNPKDYKSSNFQDAEYSDQMVAEESKLEEDKSGDVEMTNL